MITVFPSRADVFLSFFPHSAEGGVGLFFFHLFLVFLKHGVLGALFVLLRLMSAPGLSALDFSVFLRE